MPALKPIGVVVATGWEARPVLKHFRLTRVKSHLYRGEFEGNALLLCVSGVGKEDARRASFRLFQEGAGELISAGFCGALTDELSIGDVVSHRIITVDSPVRNRTERQALLVRTNPLAVDMETQAIIEAGTRCGVPIRVCRVVSDRLDDDLTPLFGSDHAFSALKIALRLLNPATWPLAARLRRHSATAGRALVSALEDQFRHPASVLTKEKR